MVNNVKLPAGLDFFNKAFVLSRFTKESAVMELH